MDGFHRGETLDYGWVSVPKTRRSSGEPAEKMLMLCGPDGVHMQDYANGEVGQLQAILDTILRGETPQQGHERNKATEHVLLNGKQSWRTDCVLGKLTEGELDVVLESPVSKKHARPISLLGSACL